MLENSANQLHGEKVAPRNKMSKVKFCLLLGTSLQRLEKGMPGRLGEEMENGRTWHLEFEA